MMYCGVFLDRLRLQNSNGRDCHPYHYFFSLIISILIQSLLVSVVIRCFGSS